MNAFERLIVDELRREFRRTCPPLKAINPGYQPAIVFIKEDIREGFRVVWLTEQSPVLTGRTLLYKTRQITLVELLQWT